MSADEVNPVELEHRLTTIEVGQQAGFDQVKAALSEQGQAQRLSIDNLTKEVGKQNGRVKDLETWRGTYEHRIVAAGEAAAEAQHETTQLAIRVGELQKEAQTKADQAQGRDGILKTASKAIVEGVKIGAALGLLTLLQKQLGG